MRILVNGYKFNILSTKIKAPHLPKGASNHIKHKILYEKKFISLLIYTLFLFNISVIFFPMKNNLNN